MEKHIYNHNGIFEFEAGGAISNLCVAYHCSEGGYHGQKVIWICHALTADSNAEDWWEPLVGPGKLFDTKKYFVVCGSMLGSCYGSSGPTSINPDTGKPYYFDFPRITVRDIVRSLNLLRESLGIPSIDLLIGASIGGFQALEFSIMYPDAIKRAVYIATLARVTPWLTAFEESQRMALEADPSFRACENLDGGKAALRSARTIALLSYRNEDGYNLKQPEPDEDAIFADRAASYQRYQGDKFIARFDAYSYWYLTYSVDSENVGRGRGGVRQALKMIKADATVVGITGDLIFPPYEMVEMAALIGAPYHEISSHFGHDGFLIEHNQIEEIISPIINEL